MTLEEESDDINLLIARALAGELTESEREHLEAWMKEHPERRAEIAKLQAIWTASSIVEVPAGETFESRWAKIEERTAGKVKPFAGFYRVAASILLFAIVSTLAAVWIGSGVVSIATKNGEIRQVQLPDGSTVTLNAASTIEYNSLTWFLRRKISLNGEAFFKVLKGPSFSVGAGKASVEVLGTSFNVKQRNDIVSVACFTGKVTVNTGDEASLLEEGMKCILSDEKLTVSAFDLQRGQPTAWMERRLDFERTPLREVFQTIAQFYSVDILCDLQNDQTFTGTFEKGSEVDDVISVVCLSTGLQYKREDSSLFRVTE